MDDLPCDVIFNIFQRLPVKSLLQCRTVSKLWRNMIDDKSLANMQINVAAQQPMLLVLTTHLMRNTMCSYSVKENVLRGSIVKASDKAIAEILLNAKYTLKNSCNGLLCLVKSFTSCKYWHTNKVFVCNPLRQEVIALPEIHYKQRYGLGFSPYTQEYKVLGVSNDFTSITSIYTLGTRSWRPVSNVPPCSIYGKPAFANGALYWKIDNSSQRSTEKNNSNRIVSFDMMKEEFDVIEHPDGLGSDDNDFIDLIELRGCLALVDLSFNTHVDIWVMKDYSEKKWVKEYKITVKSRRSDNRHIKILGLWRDGEVFLSLYNNAYFSYDPKSNKMGYFHITGFDPYFSIREILSHTWSMVSVKGFGDCRKSV